VGADTPVAEHINVNAEHVLQILPKANKVQEATTSFHLHKQVNIASRAGVLAGGGPEHAHIARPVRGRAGQGISRMLTMYQPAKCLVAR
jgi:ABC-type phosphate/phosphonate transport system ATPase subunit